MGDLVSRGTRGRFRSFATGSTVGAITDAFHDEGFAPNPQTTFNDSSIRRVTAQQYLESVDWTDEQQVARAIRAMERVLESLDGDQSAFWSSLAHDGYPRDPDTGRVEFAQHRLSEGSLDHLTDASVIRSHLNRIHTAVDNDPELAIGSAKELIESTAKLVLTDRGVSFTKDDDLGKLATRAQETLSLRPDKSFTHSPDGGSGVKRILGGALNIATGVAELRNAYGTGHGRDRTPSGLGPRHAHLAANAAYLWCQLMLDTLADPNAPWRASTQQPGQTS